VILTPGNKVTVIHLRERRAQYRIAPQQFKVFVTHFCICTGVKSDTLSHFVRNYAKIIDFKT
jgi:hypothetical protein